MNKRRLKLELRDEYKCKGDKIIRETFTNYESHFHQIFIFLDRQDKVIMSATYTTRYISLLSCGRL
jgi:hypothetical protein